MSYTTLRNGIVTFLVLYLCFGVAAYYVADRYEIYPFFSWALFQRVPQHNEERWTVRFTHVNGRALAKPVFARDASPLGMPPITEYDVAIQSMAAAVRAGSASELERARQRLEGVIGQQVTYELVRYEVDPIEYWKNGTIGDVTVVDSFESGVYE